MQQNNPKMAFKGPRYFIVAGFTALIFLLSQQLLWSQQRLYVKKDAPAGGNGQSWATASNDLQDVLIGADYGDEVWVAEGVYYPTSSTDRNHSFLIFNGVRLYGGFNGTETTLQQRVLGAYETILSGNIGDTALVTDNSFNVVRIFPSDSTTRLDGLTIRDGYAVSDAFGIGSQVRTVCGGGVYVDGTAENTPQFFNCLFTKNTAKSFGGAVAALSSIFENFVSVRFESCVFLENSSPNGRGGGIAQKGVGPMEWKNNFYNCFFKNNKAKECSGYYLDSDFGLVPIRVEKTTFLENESTGSGPLYIDYLPENEIDISITDCNFIKNSASLLIAVVCLEYTPAYLADVIVKRCNVDSNQVGLSLFNLDIASDNYGGNVIIDQSKFTNNTSDNGYIRLLGLSDSIMISNVVLSNYAYSEYVINGYWYESNFFSLANSTLEYSSFAERVVINSPNVNINSSKFMGKEGYDAGLNPIYGQKRISYFSSTYYGDLYLNNCLFNLPEDRLTVTGNVRYGMMKNCIFPHKPVPTNKSIIDADTLILENNYFPRYDPALNTTSTVVLDTNNIVGLVTPVFRDSANADYRLDLCSPLVNAGTNVGVDTAATDLQGLPRLLGTHVDIGPYETPLIEMNGLPVVVPSCAALATGSIQVSVSACEQITPVSYAWTGLNGSSGTQMEGLAPGDYLITVTHNSGASLVLQATIPEALAVAATVQTTPVFCGTGMGGTAKIVLQSGTAPFLFNWGNGITDSIVTGLSYGAYAVTITDALGCTSVNTVNISRSGNLSIGFDLGLVQCRNDSNGAIVILPNNPVPPLRWLWDNGDTTAARLHLPPGIYSGTLTDAFNCGINWQVSLDNPDSLMMDTIIMVPASTQQTANGSIAVTPTGGDAPYTYQWSNGTTTALNTNLLPGPHTVTVTDHRGCTFSDTYWVEVVSGTLAPDTGSMLVWPNPVSTYLYIKNVPPDAGVVEIFSLDGKLMLQQPTDSGSQMVAVSALPSSMYLLKIGQSRLLFVKNQ